MKIPEPGWVTEARVIRVLDGDTIEVEVARRFKVRLLDPANIENKLFGAPEIDTPEGVKAKNFLTGLLTDLGNVLKSVRIFIPARQGTNLMDVQTFDRLLGFVWCDGKNISDVMLKKGFILTNQKGEKNASKD